MRDFTTDANLKMENTHKAIEGYFLVEFGHTIDEDAQRKIEKEASICTFFVIAILLGLQIFFSPKPIQNEVGFKVAHACTVANGSCFQSGNSGSF